jgi:hypothetical protein
MAQGKGKLKKYPDTDGRNVWGDKVDYSDAEKKAKGSNEPELSAKEKSQYGAKQKGIGAGGNNLTGPTSDANSVSGDAKAEKKVLEKLRSITKDNDVDLCSIAVPGTNLFCAGNKQIPRDEMPQLKSTVVAGGKADQLVKAGKLDIDAKTGEVNTEDLFKSMLEKEGITMKDPEPRQVTSLKATQNQLVGSKVNMFAKVLAGDQPFEGKELSAEDLKKWQDALREPIIASKDGYILDGHHRWAALVQHDIANGGSGDVEMDVKEVDMGATDLVDKTNKFTNDMGLATKSGGKKEKKEGTMKLADIIQEELVKELNERQAILSEGKPIPMDTPNEFAYLDFKKWVTTNTSLVKKQLLAHRGNSGKMFKTLSALWYIWAYKNAKDFTHITDKSKFGRALMVLLLNDNLIFDKAKWKATNNITHIKEGNGASSMVFPEFNNGLDTNSYIKALAKPLSRVKAIGSINPVDTTSTIYIKSNPGTADTNLIKDIQKALTGFDKNLDLNKIKSNFGKLTATSPNDQEKGIVTYTIPKKVDWWTLKRAAGNTPSTETKLTNDIVFSILDQMAQVSTTQHQLANTRWTSLEDLLGAAEDHISASNYKKFVKDVKTKYPRVK